MNAKKRLKQFLAFLGYEFSHLSRPYSVSAFLQSAGVDLVVDAGANIGQFGSLIRAGRYRGVIISFEPVPAAFAELTRMAANDEQWIVRECALGSDFGVRTLYISRDSVFSSFKRSAPPAGVFGSAVAAVAEHTTRVSTVDRELNKLSSEKVFLKLDTQGFDKEVLLGAPHTLKRTVGIQVELSSTPLYHDTWAIPDALGYLAKLGFSVCQVHPVNFSSSDGIAGLEFDFILCRSCLLPRVDCGE